MADHGSGRAETGRCTRSHLSDHQSTGNRIYFPGCGVKYVFVSNDELYEKIAAIRPKVPSIKNIYTFEPIPGADHWSVVAETLSTPAGKEQVEAISKTIHPDHLATIIYTSGTTGTPRGDAHA